MKTYPRWFYSNRAELLVPDLSHRQIKITKGDMWITLFRVRTLEQLKAKLAYFEAENAYVSTSTYRDPQGIGMKYNMQGRKGFKVYQNLILKTDFVVDIDDEWTKIPKPAKGSNESRKEKINPVEECKRIHYCLTPEFNEFIFVVTRRGFHIWIGDFYEKRCKGKGAMYPHEREQFLMEQKRLLADQLIKEGCKFDYYVTVDTRRVVRLIGSLFDDMSTICKGFTNIDDAISCYIQRHQWDDKRPVSGIAGMNRSLWVGRDVAKGVVCETDPELSNTKSLNSPSTHNIY